MSNPSSMSPELIADLVVANRVLYKQGVVDGFGHISVRSDKNPNRYYLARSMAPALVKPDDIMEFDLESTPVDARGRGTYLERFIHGQIYRARPDVQSVCHSHSPNIIPFGVTSVQLRPIYHMSSFLGSGVPVFDINKVAGDTDMLITNNDLGAALAKALATNPVALMRGHGSVAVANSVRQAVYRAIYTELNARLQADAIKLGPVTYLNAKEVEKASSANENAVNRPWELWRRSVMAEI